MIKELKVLFILILAIVITGCMQTNYRPLKEKSVNNGFLSRNVYFHVSDEYYKDVVDCTIILPERNQAESPTISNLIQESIRTQLYNKFRRVIGPAEVIKFERDLGLDIHQEQDRGRLASIENCLSYIEWQVADRSDEHLVVWSQKRIGLTIRLVHARSNATLWHATHTASRSDGGVPLSLVSLPIAAVEATLFNQDRDQLPSMIDDVTRRLIKTLPLI